MPLKTAAPSTLLDPSATSPEASLTMVWKLATPALPPAPLVHRTQYYQHQQQGKPTGVITPHQGHCSFPPIQFPHPSRLRSSSGERRDRPGSQPSSHFPALRPQASYITSLGPFPQPLGSTMIAAIYKLHKTQFHLAPESLCARTLEP